MIELPVGNAAPPERLYFLDGLRGWMALSVVMYHSFLALYPAGLDAAGILGRLLANGPLAVYVFFTVSGFSAATAFWATGDRGAVLMAAIQRYPRLMLPILASSALAAALMVVGLMANGAAADGAGTADWLGAHYRFSPDLESLLTFSLVTVFVDGDIPLNYNAVLWIMPIELAGSMTVFALLLVAGRRWAMPVAGCLLLLSVWRGSHLTAFLLGMALAWLFHRPALQARRESRAALAAGLVLAGAAGLMIGDGGTWISAPPVMSLLAALILGAGLVSRRLAAPFETRLSRRLGRLSFSIYLVHLPLLCSIVCWAYLWLAGLGLEAGTTRPIVQALTLVIAVAAASLFSPVEALTHRLARRVVPPAALMALVTPRCRRR